MAIIAQILPESNRIMGEQVSVNNGNIRSILLTFIQKDVSINL